MDYLVTIIEVIFVSKVSTIKPNELSFQLNFQGNTYKLDKNNQIKFNADCPKSKIYYGETITVLFKDKIICTFHFLIYINKKNLIIFDMDGKAQPSFELFFYAKESNYSPTSVRYKGVEYSQFMNYGNKLRSRIFFANINPDKLEYINSDSFDKYKSNFKNYTYQAIFRFFDHRKYEVTLTNMQSYIHNYIDIKYENLSTEQLENLQNNLLDFSDVYLKFIYGDTVKDTNLQHWIQVLKDSSERIITDDSYILLDNPNMNKYDSYEEKDILDLFHKDFLLNEFIGAFNNDIFLDWNDFCSIRKKIKNNHELEAELLKKLTKDKNLKIEQKLKILKTTTIFFKNALRKQYPISSVNYINMEKISKKNPYFKSRELIKKIISELTEESRLFEAFLYFDSEIIENILSKNLKGDEGEIESYIYQDLFGYETKFDIPKFTTEYGISLMTLEEIKQNMLDLLPDIIIQIDANISLRALYEDKTKIMLINEYTMFQNCHEINENNFKSEPELYIIPISMEILHEILGHANIRSKIEENNSPLVVRDRKNNFKPLKIMRKVKLFDNKEIEINKGETGRVLEHYISDDKEVIQKLKMKSFNAELIDIKYWTDTNFDLLHEALNSQAYKNNNINTENDEIILCDSYNYEQYYDCIFH